VRAWYLPCKHAAGWLLAFGAAAAASPLLLVMAGLAKLTSPGPAFYTQVRLGRGGKAFRMYKIRTMTHNCEVRSGPVWARASDSRVTPIGQFLRDTHLDELPQLWNVLRGQMSLIGPRPERPELVAMIETQLPGYRNRLLVRPGLTGLAQVQLPADSDLRSVRQKLAYDLFYVRRIGPVLDLRIAIATAVQLTGLCLATSGKVLVSGCRKTVERDLEAAEAAEALLRRPVSELAVGLESAAAADAATQARPGRLGRLADDRLADEPAPRLEA
jgi:lipopolysaccharide/colanic/teichoic acid biosynthesis glycosyltransferase